MTSFSALKDALARTDTKIWRDQDGGDGKQSYTYRFSLVEHAFGLEIGGEMRGAYKEPGTEYVIYLGKRFNFVKLLDFL